MVPHLLHEDPACIAHVGRLLLLGTVAVGGGPQRKDDRLMHENLHRAFQAALEREAPSDLMRKSVDPSRPGLDVEPVDEIEETRAQGTGPGGGRDE
jgi:hypothetical protein